MVFPAPSARLSKAEVWVYISGLSLRPGALLFSLALLYVALYAPTFTECIANITTVPFGLDQV